MKKKERESTSMKDAVQSFLKVSGLEQEYTEKNVLGKWEEIVGKPIALRTESLKINSKTLYISFNSSVMRDELFQQKSKIIELMNKEAGFEIINDIYFH